MNHDRWFALPVEGDGGEAPGNRVTVVSRIAVVGAGQMGVGIAEVSARAGLDVTVLDVDQAAVDRGRARLEDSLERGVRRGKLDESDRYAALQRVAFVDDRGALDRADVAVEAVVEFETVKREVFTELYQRLPDALFVSSNTSLLSIQKLARATTRRNACLASTSSIPCRSSTWSRWFRPLSSCPSTAALAEAFVTDLLRKTAIRAPDRAGFVVNALPIPHACARLLEMGPTAEEEIDEGMIKGCHHPMGLLAQADLLGLDPLLAVSESLYQEFDDPFCSPPSLLRRLAERQVWASPTIPTCRTG